jgi:hypothetical protein
MALAGGLVEPHGCRKNQPLPVSAAAATGRQQPRSGIMKGRCLCGAVSFALPDTREAGACHGGTCRRWGAGPLLAVHCGPDVVFQGSDNITVFASSEWAERAFCKVCGTRLYCKLLATGDHYMPAGAIDSNDFEMASQIYVDKRPACHA